MAKLDSAQLLALSDSVANTLIEQEISFLVRDEVDTATVHVKRLSYDENNNLFKDVDLKELPMADFIKMRVQATIYNKDTNQPLFADVAALGKVLPQIVSALADAAEKVNDWSGKQSSKALTKTNSGVSSSSTESVDAPSKTQSET